MSKTLKNTASLAFLAVCIVGSGANAFATSVDTVYSMLPTDGTAAVPSYSVGYYAQGVSEFGALVSPSGGDILYAATLYMTTEALSAYSAPITLNIYGIQTATDGTLYADNTDILATATTTQSFAAAPVAVGTTCSAGYYDFSSSACGIVTQVDFAFTGVNAISVPSSFIFGISFPNSAQSLNVNLTGYDQLGTYPTVGANPLFDSQFCASTSPIPAPGYGCSTTLVDNTFTPGQLTQNVGWASSGSVAISFDATPEPATFGLIGFGLLGLAAAARRKKSNS